MKTFIGSLLVLIPLTALSATDGLKIFPATEIEFTTVIGGTYLLQTSSNMVDWVDCEIPWVGDGSTVNRFYSTRVSHQRFYRLLVELPPEGTLTNMSQCKSASPAFQTGLARSPTTAEECLQYDWDGQGTLRLRHVNAGFNCCPEELIGTVAIETNTITLTEIETGGLCNCDCLFDLDYQILHLKPGSYTLQIVPTGYVPEGDSPLSFVVELTALTNGLHCVKRAGYPWHPPAPSGMLMSHSACKSSAFSAVDVASSSEDCLEYTYDASTATLLLNHINVGFNCCPSNMQGQVTISSGQIDIVESETAGLCHCLCLYDLNYQMNNVTPGTYAISVTEPYMPKTDPPLTVTIDLIANPAGRICLPRSGYPWGQ